jgi:hypothetical protein
MGSERKLSNLNKLYTEIVLIGIMMDVHWEKPGVTRRIHRNVIKTQPTCLITYLLNYLLTYSLTYLLTYYLITYLLTYSLTYLLITYLLTCLLLI